MDPTTNEWLNLALRWTHVFAGILWIGQTYFFTWLDGRLNDQAENHGQVWMVHSGGFYVVEKRKQLEDLARKLHWFKWEAALTWASGFMLLLLMFYLGGSLVNPEVRALSEGAAAAIGLGTIAGGWLVYDLIWRSPLAAHERVGAGLCYVLLVGVAYALTHTFGGRVAYIHVGAMMGTIMATNVWVRILPVQRRLLAEMKEGRTPDLRPAETAKQRSRHNTFMVVPLVFIMLSNHYPTTTYGTDHAWAVLGGLILLGWGAAKIIRER